MASFSAMQFLFAPLWGRLSDRIGRRPVLMIGLAGSVVFYALFGVATVMQEPAAVVRVAHRGRHCRRHDLDRAGLHRRRHDASEPGPRHGPDRSGLWPGLHVRTAVRLFGRAQRRGPTGARPGLRGGALCRRRWRWPVSNCPKASSRARCASSTGSTAAPWPTRWPRLAWAWCWSPSSCACLPSPTSSRRCR